MYLLSYDVSYDLSHEQIESMYMYISTYDGGNLKFFHPNMYIYRDDPDLTRPCTVHLAL